MFFSSVYCWGRGSRMRALKPGYDSFAVQGDLIQSVCDFFGRTFDDSEAKRHASLRGHRPYDDYWCEVMGENPTLNETARHFHMTPAKVRKILITGGRFDTVLSREIKRLTDDSKAWKRSAKR